MAHSEDEDEFLYGSDTEQPAAKKQKLGPENGESGAGESSVPAANELSESEEEEESSDDDIEFVIGESAPKVSTTSAPSTLGETLAQEKTGEDKQAQPTTIVRKDDGASTIDVNAVAEYEGKPLTLVDLEEIKDKPWRAPGADISDYFNYGFDELTWTAYCHKQDKTRGEFNPQKILAKIMPQMPQMPQMPFPFPGMPGFKMPNMQNMPNMPNMPNMQNMQNMPNMPNMPPNMPMPPMPPNFKNQYKK